MNHLIAQRIYELFPFRNLRLDRLNDSILRIKFFDVSNRYTFFDLRKYIESTGLIMSFNFIFDPFLLLIEAFDQSCIVNCVLEPAHYDRSDEEGHGHEAARV